MNIAKWAAVAVTGLLALLTFGVVLDSHQTAGVRLVAFLLFAAGAGAAVGLAIGKAWAKGAIVAIGVVNVVLAILSIRGVLDTSYIGTGDYTGVVLGGLGILFGIAA